MHNTQYFVAFLKELFYLYFSSGAWEYFEWQIYWLPVSFHRLTKWLLVLSVNSPLSLYCLQWLTVIRNQSIYSVSSSLRMECFFYYSPVARSYSLFQKMLSGSTRYRDAFKHKLTWFSTTLVFNIKLSVLGLVFLSHSLTRLLHSWADTYQSVKPVLFLNQRLIVWSFV